AGAAGRGARRGASRAVLGQAAGGRGSGTNARARRDRRRGSASGMEIEARVARVPRRVRGRARRIGIDAEAEHARAGRAAKTTPPRNRRGRKRGERRRILTERITCRLGIVVEAEAVTAEEPLDARRDRGDEARELG